MLRIVMYDKPELPQAPDHYAALGVSPDATSITIKKAFRKLALEFHPDKMAPGETVDAVGFRKVNCKLSSHYAQN
jgi:curved DNA-binding protein CbpA